ncbi:MAG: lanthionine synthetase LanC family protein [Pseudomonadota bacterium]
MLTQGVSVSDLAERVRASIETEIGDYAITKRHSRMPSRIIDKDSADLLKLFRSPIRIVHAVLAYAAQRNLDADQVLSDAYALLSGLFDSKMLVPAESSNLSCIATERIGNIVAGLKLVRCLQRLDESEVYLANDCAGRYAAVKTCSTENVEGVYALEHEAHILECEGGVRTPKLLSLTRAEGSVYLVTDWVFGLDVGSASDGLRGQHEPRNEQKLMELSRSIAVAYAQLHSSGMLHGDVHPRNVIVQSNGEVKLIDFGLAVEIRQTVKFPPRGGVAFFLDPGLASAQLCGGSASLDPASEQYSVAALIYFVWTGAHYVEWRLERSELLRQIVEQAPAPFSAHGIPDYPELEAILGRALRKEATERFASMSAFATAICSLELQTPHVVSAAQNVSLLSRDQSLLQQTLERYRVGGSVLQDGPARAPFASINYGASGIAYVLYRIAQHRSDAKILAAADAWTHRAYKLSSNEKAFYDPGREIRLETVGTNALYHSDAGIHCVRCLVCTALGDVDGAARGLEYYLESSQRRCERPDLTLGLAGQLLGLCEIIEACPVPGILDPEPARHRGGELANDLLKLAASEMISTSTTMPSLGMAHGWAGVLFALLRWTRVSASQPDPCVLDRLDELTLLAEPCGYGLRWPVFNSTGPATFMDSWCNGTAGHAMLFALAAEVLADHRYASIAERAAESAWITNMQLGTLCCGTAGVSYGLLAVHRVTGEKVWIERARTLLRRAASNGFSDHFEIDSLYKGAVGVALLAEEIHEPTRARMPLCEATPV